MSRKSDDSAIPKWLQAKLIRDTRHHEERFAKKTGGHTLKASGAVIELPHRNYPRVRPRAKTFGAPEETAGADVTSDTLHLEHKSTTRESISIKYAWLKKVTRAAKREGKIPAVGITFERDMGDSDWILLPLGAVDFGTEDSEDECEHALEVRGMPGNWAVVCRRCGKVSYE